MSFLTEEQLAQIEKNEGFDRDEAEDLIRDWMEQEGVSSGNFFFSRQPGVLAIEQIDFSVRPKLSELAEHLSDRMDAKLVNVADCDWTFDDRCDEEATLFAFDIPSLNPDYRNDYRNLLAIGAHPAP